MRLKRLLVLSILAFAISSASFSQFVKKHGQLHVQGVQLMDQNNEPIVLRGMSFGWHNWWPRFYTKGTVQWLKSDWGVTVLRAAMGVEGDTLAYTSRPQWSKKLICEVVDAAIKEDIYVIIDWHSHSIRLNEAREFFDEMSKKYGKNPHVIYEIFNEPVNDTWSDVKSYSIEIINTIRKNDPDNIILVGNPHWDQDVHLCADDPIVGQSNIMYTLHYYAATHKDYLRERGDYALGKGIPLFISEASSMEASGDGLIDYAQWKIWLDWSEQRKISWVLWSISDKGESCSILYPCASSNGKWIESDLRESGIADRKLLRSYNLNEK